MVREQKNTKVPDRIRFPGSFAWRSFNFVLLLLIVPLMMAGQGLSRPDKLLENARNAYERGDVSRAIAIAGRITTIDPSHIKTYLFLADVYHDLDSVNQEISRLEKAIALNSKLPLFFYRLAEAYYKAGDYGIALSSLNRYFESGTTKSLTQKANRLRINCEFAAEAIKHPVAFSPVSLGDSVNSIYDEYWPSLTVDNATLVFTRLLPLKSSPGLKQEDFYASYHDSSGWSSSHPLNELNTPANEGAQSVSADGRLLFFTLCNHPDGFGSCDIWFSRYENGIWTKPVNAGSSLNTAGWDGQPSLSAFGDHLFFSSDRPGGKGGKDIWMATLKGWTPGGLPVWGEITNPGDSINTAGDEISPFIHPNDMDLYFCSDSWPGFGGYDIFHSHYAGRAGWGRAGNFGYPVNSPGNEQGLIIDRSGAKAYFSSDRGKTGNMDIYTFVVDEKIRPEAVSYLRGKIVSSKTGLPVAARIRLSGTGDLVTQEETIQSGEDGIFTIVLPLDITLSLSINKEGFLFYSVRFRLTGPSTASEPEEKTIRLTPVEPGSTVNLYNIFFATNEYSILPESKAELNTLLDFLRENPSLSVEIGGHTDNVGTAEFNLQLSEKRAGSVKQFLLNKGIAAGRLSSKGYGMDQPEASNDTEEDRARNRRTTMKIVE